MAVLERILAIPELDSSYLQMGISGKSPAKMMDMMGKKSMMKGDKKMKPMMDDGDGNDDEDEMDDEDDKMKKMRDRLKKMKGKLPTGSMTQSDNKPQAMKSSY